MLEADFSTHKLWAGLLGGKGVGIQAARGAEANRCGLRGGVCGLPA